MANEQEPQPNPATDQLLANRLRDAREVLGLSQEDVAEALDLPRPAISAIETGKRRVTSSELKDFARLYRRDYTYLLDGESASLDSDPLDFALFRMTHGLSEYDKEQVLRFARFLKTASPPPKPLKRKDDPSDSSS